ncbi:MULTISPECIES: ATP-binding protein [Streptomyces]|uniref:ATP-binding protein n=1 Tax=Streptomyces TaxID=1883 RepID=UPI001E29A7E3|nr:MULTISPECIES: ATP-binding protein [Streptomyces]UFQ16355.1 ATP-binding protein [Streptomyces huasconensis]WCL85958.1 ATP-binding protein [Streptomyces sp. JCM 35825]
MTAPTPIARPGTERPPLRPAAFVLLACALVTAVLAGTAAALAPASARTPLAWGAGAAALAFSVAVAVAFHALRSLSLARRHLAAARQESGLLQREQARRAAEFGQEHARLTAAHAREVAELTAEHARVAAELAAENGRVKAELTAENTRARAELTAEHTRVRNELTARLRTAESERAAALSACANAAGRMQALATGTLADLREMEGRHADEDVLTDLLHLDHRTAQAGRIADSVAVLTGARSGRRWAKPIVMESILRGAMGRIGGYQRVRVHSASEVAVAGHAAEGVMHALAELLDNAANFSPPTSEVHVYIEEVAAGVIVSVEDSGLVMGPVQLRRAERAVSGETTGLGGLTGTRLGLAVVGRLARKYNLTVSFRPSARGGTGVLLLIPQELLSRPSDPTPSPSTSLPTATSRPAALPGPADLPEPAALTGPADPARPADSTGPAASTDPTDSARPAHSTNPDPTGPAALTPARHTGRHAARPEPAHQQPQPQTPQPQPQPQAQTPHPQPPPPRTPPEPRPPYPHPHTPDPGLDPVDREPVPAHESAAPHTPAEGPDAEAAPLPKRPRGRTLAAAERARADSDTGEHPRPRRADAATTAARFSSFRQAVRTAPTEPVGTDDAPANPEHPEGDTSP